MTALSACGCKCGVALNKSNLMNCGTCGEGYVPGGFKVLSGNMSRAMPVVGLSAGCRILRCCMDMRSYTETGNVTSAGVSGATSKGGGAYRKCVFVCFGSVGSVAASRVVSCELRREGGCGSSALGSVSQVSSSKRVVGGCRDVDRTTGRLGLSPSSVDGIYGKGLGRARNCGFECTMMGGGRWGRGWLL